MKQATGLKEILLALYATTVALFWLLLYSHRTVMIVLEAITNEVEDDDLVDFANLANPVNWNLKL